LADGSCPCPDGYEPCSQSCGAALNCPLGCCAIGSCQCLATPPPTCPEFPASCGYSYQKGCCIDCVNGECLLTCEKDNSRLGCSLPGVDSCDQDKCCPNGAEVWYVDQTAPANSCCKDQYGNCIFTCKTDASRLGCDAPNTDACNNDSCCPSGTVTWGQNPSDTAKKCCLGADGNCILVCSKDPTRAGCPTPGADACDQNGCCPSGSSWSSEKSCCIDGEGVCVNLCSNVVCPVGQVCDPQTGQCIDPCAGVTCPVGQICDPATGNCTSNPCAGVNCPSGQICVNGQCVIDPCANVICPSGQVCRDGACVDPCAGVTCPAGQVCQNGQCINDPCANVVCPAGQACDPATGTCTGAPTDPCIGITCPSGQVCKDGTCVDPCAGVTCPAGQVCQNGVCIDPCAGVVCPSGQVCVNGQCTSDLCSNVDCPVGQVCDPQTGQCVSVLVSCNYEGPYGLCNVDVLCTPTNCADQGRKCNDLRQPAGVCKQTSSICQISADCCCGLNCQKIPGFGFPGVCCSGGLWTCFPGIS
jgi:hypothetical protein